MEKILNLLINFFFIIISCLYLKIFFKDILSISSLTRTSKNLNKGTGVMGRGLKKKTFFICLKSSKSSTERKSPAHPFLNTAAVTL